MRRILQHFSSRVNRLHSTKGGIKVSVIAIGWAWKQQIEPTDKFILLALSDHANDEDYTCWPSLSHLQRKTGYSRPTIWKSIDRLIKAGAVSRVGDSQNGSTLYKIHVGNQITLGNKVTQVTSLPGVGNQINMLGNDVTPKPSLTISEPSSSGEPEDSPLVVVVFLPLVNGSEYPITEQHIDEWKKAYPALDVRLEAARMRAWLIANPKNRKTKTGILRFCNSWLSRNQDRARPERASSARGVVI